MDILYKFLAEHHIAVKEVQPVAQSGGDRQYFIITNQDDTKCIATVSNNIIENEAFFYFTNIFQSINAAVPKMIAISEDKQMYVQTYGGAYNLLEVVLQEGYTPEVFNLYKKALAQLAKLQLISHDKIDYSKCIASPKFDAQAVLFDLNYCLQYYVDAKNIQYNSNALQLEFASISELIAAMPNANFMYRDFQGRNIMVAENRELLFIDYQGGMQGPLQYDVASLLWQAKAQLPKDWKEDLLLYYFNSVQLITGNQLNKEKFINDYYLILLTRLLQVLGAYGRRGLLEGKQHFIESIPSAVANLQTWLNYKDITATHPQIHQLIHQIISTK
jgi:aminoglycoside/choline kinase family phosphotransferase